MQEGEAVLRPRKSLDLAQLDRTFTLRTSDGFVENVGPAILERVRAGSSGRTSALRAEGGHGQRAAPGRSSGHRDRRRRDDGAGSARTGLVPGPPDGGLIAIDNALWGGRVADPNTDNDSAKILRALNVTIAADTRVDASMLTVGDGVMLARKR